MANWTLISSIILLGAATFLTLTYAVTARKWYKTRAGRTLMTVCILGVSIMTFGSISYRIFGLDLEIIRALLVILKLTLAGILVGVGISIEHTQVQAYKMKRKFYEAREHGQSVVEEDSEV